MKIGEAKDLIIKREICAREHLMDLCKDCYCDGCVFDYNIDLENDALELLRDYYIKKQLRKRVK